METAGESDTDLEDDIDLATALKDLVDSADTVESAKEDDVDLAADDVGETDQDD